MMKRIIRVLIFSIFIFLTASSASANSVPELRDGSVNPNLVPFETPVVFSVTYTDPDGDAPKFVRVVTSKWSKDMTKASGDFKSGARFEYRWAPQEGDQGSQYHFEASDGLSEIRFPIYQGGTLAPFNIIDKEIIKSRLFLFKKESNQPIVNVDLGDDPVVNVAISSNGSYWAAKTASTIYLFSGQNKTPDWKFQCPTVGKVSVDMLGWVAISSDGNYIAGGCHNGLYFFSKEANKPLWSYLSNQGYTSVYNVAISDQGDYIALGATATDNGGLLALFSKDSNQPLWVQRFNPGNVHALAMSSDGNYIAAGTHCPDRKTYLFSRHSNEPLIGYVASEGSPVWTAAISANGQSAVYGLDSAGTYNGILLFNPDNKNPVRKWQTDWWIRSLSMSFDGKYIAAGGGDSRLYFIAKDKDQPVWKFEAGDRIGSVAISSDGQYLAGGSRDKKVYLLSQKNNQPLWEYLTSSWVNAVAISADGNFLVAGNGIAHYLAEGQHEVYNNPNKQAMVQQSPPIASQETQEGNNLTEANKMVSAGAKLPGMLFSFGFIGSLFSLGIFTALKRFKFLEKQKKILTQFNVSKLSFFKLTGKKVTIILLALTILFLFLIIVLSFVNKYSDAVIKKTGEEAKPKSGRTIMNEGSQLQDQTQNQTGQPKSSPIQKGEIPQGKTQGVCGNGLCEPNLGESKSSCSQDCSAGD